MPALVRGTVERASKINEGTASLRLAGPPRGGSITHVVVLVPLEMLQAVTKRKLHELEGLTVEVEATPKMTFGSVRLPVTPASAFSLGS